MEETTVPAEVIFSAGAEHERAVAALGEIRDSWGARNWKCQSVTGVKFLGQLSSHFFEFAARFGAAGRSLGERASNRCHRRFQQVATQHRVSPVDLNEGRRRPVSSRCRIPKGEQSHDEHYHSDAHSAFPSIEAAETFPVRVTEHRKNLAVTRDIALSLRHRTHLPKRGEWSWRVARPPRECLLWQVYGSAA